MRHYKVRTQSIEYLDRTTCDGCGAADPYLMVVAIEVHLGEEGGRRDEYDYCDHCLLERADALVAAGSRSELVTGEDPEEPTDDRP